MAPKRKALARANGHNASPQQQQHRHQPAAGDSGVVQRQFYPREMANARAAAYAAGGLPTPMDELERAVAETARAMAGVPPPSATAPAVVHWFRRDLRTRDNRALAAAAGLARPSSRPAATAAPLIGLFVVSPQDWQAHATAPVRVDLVLRTLRVLQADLAKLGIPLWIEPAVTPRAQVPQRVLARMRAWGARHLFANMEYEVDELRRDAALVRLCATQGMAFTLMHDACLVPPGLLRSASGSRPYAVYTPWFRAWKQHLRENEDLLDLADAPVPLQLAEDARLRYADLFDCPVPEAPDSKRLARHNDGYRGHDSEDGGDDESEADLAARFQSLWPAGEDEAQRRLEAFCDTRISNYADCRDLPAADATSTLSPYLACGALSARTVIQTACDRAGATTLEGSGNSGLRVFISEVAWRDFYKHILVGWPHICMYKPFKPAYAGIQWDHNPAHFAAWARGRTGFPIVDAAMRQLRHEGWMHNRCRMVVASFLAKDLLLDWRLGERFFMEHLADGDLASNVGGWGYAAGVGADPQPYFRIFNPQRQSERFDPDGAYIRRWVPELRAIADGRAIHAPYANGAADEARATGYPEPMVDHKAARERALAVYKEALSAGT